METELIVTIVGVVAMAVGAGVARGISYFAKRNGNGSKRQPAGVTGEHARLMTVPECRGRHEELAEDLRRGSDKFEKLAAEQSTIKEAVLELKGDVRTGFAEVKGAMTEAVESGLYKHERLFHRRSGSTGDYKKPR